MAKLLYPTTLTLLVSQAIVDIAIPPAQLEATSVSIVGIGNGNTIQVRRLGQTITARLGRIDAPELTQSLGVSDRNIG